jgi:ATP-dependent exoDNAse (exonuclease V) beta subunit
MGKVELTKSQQLAARLSGKNILVSAGAGTGKTSVLVERFLNFVVSGQVPVSEILALTFTEKAANEMKSRIRLRLMELGIETAVRDLESACISTIHAFAARVLKEHPLEARVDPDFRVIEEEEMDFLREQALDEVLELHCQKGNDIFELLHRYEEWKIKEGLTKVLQTARHEGKTLREFFEPSLSLRAPKGQSNPVFPTRGGSLPDRQAGAFGGKNGIASSAFRRTRNDYGFIKHGLTSLSFLLILRNRENP